MVPNFEYFNYVIHSNNDVCPAFFFHSNKILIILRISQNCLNFLKSLRINQVIYKSILLF